MRYEDWQCRDCKHACEKGQIQTAYVAHCEVTGRRYGNVVRCPDKRKAKDG